MYNRIRGNIGNIDPQESHGLSMSNKAQALEISVDGRLVLLCAYTELLTFITVEAEPKIIHTIDEVFTYSFCEDLSLVELLHLKGIFCCMLSNKMQVYAEGLDFPSSQ